jgi:ubiquinone/menaquinone biosynthesis C-methylase UbiE
MSPIEHNMDQTPPVIDYEGSDYQQSFWEKGGRDYENQVEAVALERLLPRRGELMLELGAGAGRNTPRYSGFERVVLLDYSQTQLQQAQSQLGKSNRYTYVAADVYRLPFVDGLFDTATMIRTLHHLVDAPRALNQVHNVLRPAGCFILEYANKRNLKAVIRFLLRKQNWNPFLLEQVEFAELNFDFHPRTVKSWLQEAGFTIHRQLTVSHFRIGFIKRTIPTGVLVKLDALAQLTGDWWQFSPSVFVRSQASASNHGAVHGAFFKCPICDNSSLEKQEHGLICVGCSTEWPIRDGIYDFRLN